MLKLFTVVVACCVFYPDICAGQSAGNTLANVEIQPADQPGYEAWLVLVASDGSVLRTLDLMPGEQLVSHNEEQVVFVRSDGTHFRLQRPFQGRPQHFDPQGETSGGVGTEISDTAAVIAGLTAVGQIASWFFDSGSAPGPTSGSISDPGAHASSDSQANSDSGSSESLDGYRARRPLAVYRRAHRQHAEHDQFERASGQRTGGQWGLLHGDDRVRHGPALEHLQTSKPEPAKQHHVLAKQHYRRLRSSRMVASRSANFARAARVCTSLSSKSRSIPKRRNAKSFVRCSSNSASNPGGYADAAIAPQFFSGSPISGAKPEDFSSDSLKVRPFEPADAQFWLGIYRDEKVKKQMYAAPTDSADALISYLSARRVFTVWLGDLRVGGFTITTEKDRLGTFGIVVESSHRGRGLSSEIMRLMEHEARNLGVLTLRGDVYADNMPSIRALENAGFRKFLWFEKNIE